MKYCQNCLETNTRPTAIFDKNGICLACNNFIKNQEMYNESQRLDVLNNLVKKIKKDNKKFDCIIGVSGGKDSTRQALWIRDKLNLKPLLVCGAYPPDQITEVGVNNLSNLINLGFDLVVSAPAPQFWQKTMKSGFFAGNYLRGPELQLHTSQVQVAIKYGIKTIFWGESPANVWNDTKTKMDLEYDGNALRNSNTLKNCDLDWMKDFSTDKTKLIPYQYPNIKDFEKNNIQIIFLAWFWNNWSMVNNAKFSTLNGLEPRSDHVSNTGDLYGVMALDEDWVTLNQMIKYYKYGHGRASDYLNLEIRLGNITRDEAIPIVKNYDGACSEKYVESFCKYLDITSEKFWSTVSQFVNKDLFTINNKKSGKKYIPKFEVGTGI